MMPFKSKDETIEQFKQRLIDEVAAGSLSAADAFEAYETATMYMTPAQIAGENWAK